MEYILFEESKPDEVAAMLGDKPVAYVPMGALEWHGEHAPLGLDGLKAYAICERVAALTGGVLFPAVFWGAFDTMPFPYTLKFSRRIMKLLVRETLDNLSDMGFRMIVMLSGHYPPTMVRLLRRESVRFNMLKVDRAFALGAPEQVFATDIGYFGDHAGMWETSIMMALKPELVDPDKLPSNMNTLERLEKHGVMGKDPKSLADPEKGRAVIEHIAKNIADIVDRTLDENNDAAIREAYACYDRDMRILSPNAGKLIREALDVRSLGELIRYGIWTLRNMR